MLLGAKSKCLKSSFGCIQSIPRKALTPVSDWEQYGTFKLMFEVDEIELVGFNLQIWTLVVLPIQFQHPIPVSKTPERYKYDPKIFSAGPETCAANAKCALDFTQHGQPS